MYFAYGFPKSYRILAGVNFNDEVVYASFNGSDNLVIVTSTTIQLWNGGQQKIKLGELVRDEDSIEEEGVSIRAWWCPSRRVIAVATRLGHILFFGLHSTKEILWKSPNGVEARKVVIYLQNSTYLPEINMFLAEIGEKQGEERQFNVESGGNINSKDSSLGVVDRVADLCGDAKSLGVILENGTILSFSWAAKLRCSASPLLNSSQNSNGRSSRNRLRRGFSSPTDDEEEENDAAINGTGTSLSTAATTASAPPWLADAYNQDDSLPLPTPIDTQDVPIAVRGVSYAPAAQLMTIVLQDGRVAVLSLPIGGLSEIEHARCLRWIYKPTSHAVRAVTAAVQPSGHYIAVGVAHGRVAIYSMTRILTPVNAPGGKYQQNSRPTSTITTTSQQNLHHRSSMDSSRITCVQESSSGGHGVGYGSAGQPEPDHILSLTEWGYSSSLLGPANVLRWSPDGKVVAAGYGYRGLAVWTPSGCRVMCTLRQAAQGMAVGNGGCVSTGAGGILRGMRGVEEDGSRLESNKASDFESLETEIGSPSGLNPHYGAATTTPAPTTTTSASGGAASTSTGAATGILEGGVAALAWSQHGYSLMVVEAPPLIGSPSPVAVLTEQPQPQQLQQQQQQLLEICFARAVHSGHRVAEARPLGPAGGAANEQQQGGGAYPSTSGGLHQQQSASPEGAFVLQGADRLLLVLETMPSSVAAVHAGLLDASEAEAVLHWQPDLTLQHVRLPQEYLDSAFPILHVAVSPGSRDIAVAGTRGLAVLNCKTRKWRLFGDAMQERRVKTHALTWLPRGIVAAIASVDETTTSKPTSSVISRGGKLAFSSSSSSGVSLATSGGALSPSLSATPTLLLFPRDHLDFSSLVARYPLPQLPAAVDAVGPFLALAYAPLEICLLRVDFLDQQQKSTGAGATKAGATSAPKATLTSIRELNILGLGGPLQELTLLPPSLLPATEEENEQEEEQNNGTGTGAKVDGWLNKSISSNAVSQIKFEEGPSHCVLLRGGGILSVLDLQNGTESVLSDQIESYWVPQSSGSKPVLPAPTTTTTPAAFSPLLSAVGRRDSAAAMPIDEVNSPAAKGAAWLERRTSDAAAAAAAMSSDELAAMAAAAASIGIGRAGSGGLGGSYGSTSLLFGSGGVVDEEPPPVEMPWWTYGARGMQLWFPSSLFDPSWGRSNFSGSTSGSHHSLVNNSAAASFAASARGGANATDPELEFDKEVYPLGISLAEVSIVGMMQRTARSGRFPTNSPPAFSLHPHPESQPVLPCLLRRLLEQGRAADALELATRHSRGPHFARSLEWLLFTTLEADADAPKDVVARRVRFASPKAVTAEERTRVFEPPAAAAPCALPADRMGVPEKRKKAAMRGVAGPLLISAARLVQQFPQSSEIVVSVARKTDAQLWPALFAAAGSPAALSEGLLSNGALQTAACCLLIVDRVEGASKAHGLALRLVRSALTASSYGLAADLLKFLMPPGENELAELTSPGQSGLVNNTGAPSTKQQHQKGENVQQQQEQNNSGGSVSWLWSYFTGADKVPAGNTASAAGGPTPAATTGTENGPAPSQEDSITRRLHRAASAGSLADGSDSDGNVAELGAAVSAWKVMGRHAWKLLDSGALRELASFGAAMSNLHGGLPALLSTAAGEVPLSLAHTTPSAAAIASALFVASNEFATAAESDVDAAAAAESLEMTCAAAGCVNHAMALALMLGDTVAVEAFAADQPRVWSLLAELIANDVHLCAFSGLLSAPTTPLMGGFDAGGFKND
ncbi:hypothetical protein Ndes2526B_g01314 [Nannochloris sp. 'desiccata']|nr:hypothetical protein NADE_008874 [Chlorella desiccata (nom. nud.)]